MSDIAFIPGPDEDAAAFEARVEVSRQLCDRLPIPKGEPLPAEAVSPALDAVEQAYEVRPDWVPVYVGNQGLSPWQGGASWILELEEPDVTVVAIQLRRNLWGMYSRQELLTHELVHAGRVAFDEAKYEEFFSYRLSSSRFRRFFGPVFQNPKEPLFFLVSWTIGCIAGVFYPLLWTLPLAVISFGFARLLYRHRCLKRCVRNLELAYPRCRPWAVAYRLTDAEIQDFAARQPEAIRDYVAQQSSLRWQDLLAIDSPLGGVS